MRDSILQQIWKTQDEAYDLMNEYDSLPHRYGDATLYQSEGRIIELIATHPGITATELAGILKKTVSACSQMIRKLRTQGWVEQVRNEKNNRLYNLQLTEGGVKVYQARARFEQECQNRTFRLLDTFSEEELAIHLEIQKRLNEAYQEDVRQSKEQIDK